jgi:hypothetical protein
VKYRSELCWNSLNALHKDIAAAVWCDDPALKNASLTTDIRGLVNQAHGDAELAEVLEVHYARDIAEYAARYQAVLDAPISATTSETLGKLRRKARQQLHPVLSA